MCWYDGFLCNYQWSIAVIKLQFSPICRPLASAAWCGPHPAHHPRYASGPWMTLNGVMALFCVISANSCSIRAQFTPAVSSPDEFLLHLRNSLNCYYFTHQSHPFAHLTSFRRLRNSLSKTRLNHNSYFSYRRCGATVHSGTDWVRLNFLKTECIEYYNL